MSYRTHAALYERMASPLGVGEPFGSGGIDPGGNEAGEFGIGGIERTGVGFSDFGVSRSGRSQPRTAATISIAMVSFFILRFSKFALDGMHGSFTF